MRVTDFVEKRRFKRFELVFPITLRYVSSDGKERAIDAVTINISWNGVYVMDIKLKDIKPGDSLHISLSVPREETRDFPFSRLIGRSKVMRVEEDGIALEFDENISRLFVSN